MTAQATPRLHALTPGQLTEVPLPGTSGLSYFAYRPHRSKPGQPVLVFVHGYGRKAEAHARTLQPLCEHLGCTLLAPFFARQQQPRYQRLGRGRDGQRADRVLNDCIADLLGNNAPPIWLSGFSGGAQFAHRYAMAHPDRVARLIAVAAGWYTMPDSTLRYPYGLHTQRTLRGYCLNPEQFLKVPTTVIVGADDTGHHNLRRSMALDASQGRTRVERARSWVAHMRVAAQLHRTTSEVTYVEVPGIGHDFAAFVARGRLLELFAEALADNNHSIDVFEAPTFHWAPWTATNSEAAHHACA